MTILTMTLLIFFSLGLLIAGLQIAKMQKKLAIQDASLQRLNSEINATSKGSIGIGNKLFNVSKQLNLLKNQQQDMVSFGGDVNFQKRTYKQATHLAKMGASIDELKSNCELSQGEAELLAHMNVNH
ncbi:MAG: DUF2802 domain-containing protein [Gammaproteobacteria bacterium]|nr:DUF2802 domain-containing protein [Gammaproteobacteria bacterium]